MNKRIFIGHLANRSKNPDDTLNIPRSLEWTPDGNRLSFVCKDTLYILPAE